MIKSKSKIIFLFLNLFLSYLCISFNYLDYSSSEILKYDLNDKIFNFSGESQKNIIVFFKNSFYDEDVISKFEFFGGFVKVEWKNVFSSFSGFAGSIAEENISSFKNFYPEATIENDEILETQMNFASIQTGGFNSTWYLDGYKGNNNCSIAVLDTGINPSHNFFPNNYNPLDLNGSIVGWEDFVNSKSIYDDNGHGTFISSVISGTGTDSYDSNSPSKVKIQENYTHSELFEDYSPSKNYSLKIFTFNVSKPNSNILINSSWNCNTNGIDNFSFELYYDQGIVNYSNNKVQNKNYIINHTLNPDELGIYDLYLKYHKQLQSDPSFSFNTTITYFPEVYIKNYTRFTGIANGSKIVAYKILNHSGIGYSSDLISALISVSLNRSKYHIISACLSIGTIGEDVKAINTVINEVINNGTLVVIAAGNSGVETSDSLNKLAQNKNAIVVGAINDNDQVTSYSSKGKEFGFVLKPDIVAPGGSKIGGHRTITSAGKESNEVTSTYGTSIATAIVSAALNILIEAKFNNWNQWNNLNVSQWVKYIKAYLLMTASETNLQREDDPFTNEDESAQSPELSSAPLKLGIKDIHEGYGRLNIQAAIDALTKKMYVNLSESDNLISSRENPLGTHVFSRQIKLTKNKQYLFNLTIDEYNADFDVLLFSNESNQYGEPILLGYSMESSKKWYDNFKYFYFTPKDNQTDCIITVKAIEGSSMFTLNISIVENKFKPELKVPEIEYIGGSKNITIMSEEEFTGNNPQKNYTIDRYRFYIDYFDNDTTNVPPQEVYVVILGFSKNYTLHQPDYNLTSPYDSDQVFLPDNNFTDGALFISNYIQFLHNGIYQYYFIGSDGKHRTRFPDSGFLNITIEYPTDSIQFPHYHSFNEGFDNWTYTGTGWGLLQQTNINDDRSRIYQDSWNSIYFGMHHNYPKNYTYQPINLTIPSFPNGTLTSPLLNLTKLNENTTHPFAYFGLRTSIGQGDIISLQINLNMTGWLPIRTYTDEEKDWFMDKINLTQYIGYFVQFRFETSLDNSSDPVNYKGFMLDYFALDNYTNKNPPQIEFNLNKDLASTQGFKFQRFSFSCSYYDLENNYPKYVYLEMDGINYTMYNNYGDWNASIDDTGILFTRSLVLEDISNKSFRFHVFDGKYITETQWYNRNNTIFEFIELEPLQFNILKDEKLIGYKFPNNSLTNYFVTGTPLQKELTAWFRGDNTWHPITRMHQQMLYGGRGNSFGSNDQGYEMNWDSNLITYPLHLNSEYKVYLEFEYEIILQNEYYVPEDQLDRCNISISNNFGVSWNLLKEYRYDSDSLSGKEKIDISQYLGEDIMIMFTLHTNDFVGGLGYGWLLYNIYIGYDKLTDFIAPEIRIINPSNDTLIKSTILIEAEIEDNIEIDESKIYIYINGKSIDRTKLTYNSNTSLLGFKWDTTQYNDGIYEIKIVAFDKAGNVGESYIFVRVDNGQWWIKWGPYIVLSVVVIIIGLITYKISEKKGKMWIEKIKNARFENMRLKDIDKDQVIKKIELVENEEELKRPIILYCKFCKSWFVAEKFDIICPVCEHDQIYAAYMCENCGKWFYKDEPRENYFCTNKTCEGVRLIRREKDEVQEILAKEGKILRKFERKKKKFSILDK
ncbi:MAG: S8 family serine peptidase [Promethearchaeota archaeon]